MPVEHTPVTTTNQTTPSGRRHRRWKRPGTKQWTGYSPLEDYCRYPDRHPADIIYRHPDYTIVFDKFPKARFHFLILPNVPVKNIYHLTVDDISLIQTMAEGAQWLVHQLHRYPAGDSPELKHNVLAHTRTKPTTFSPLLHTVALTRVQFLTGFHSIPSVPHLHLHVISDDLCGTFLKSVSKWNTFTTEFLRSPSRIVQELAQLPAQQLLHLPKDFPMEKRYFRVPVHCLQCGQQLKSIEELRQHVPPCYINVKGGTEKVVEYDEP
ncbi:hypothetical protein IWQ61_003928 [Dispira simplex]|nr:hypothetical protein IWQ61_003928 [Dispira simplex]